MPVDIYFGGSEHTTLHLLYSRFFQHALHDLGIAKNKEPFVKRYNRGLILGPDGNKMSKSKGNVIDPGQYVANVGADAVRLLLAFLGPYGDTSTYPWDVGGIAGMRRFLERVYALQDKVSDQAESTEIVEGSEQKVRSDIEKFKFNTALSTLMTSTNKLTEREFVSRKEYETLLKLLAPFAPFLTEEIWCSLGNYTSIHNEDWPVCDVTNKNKTKKRLCVWSKKTTTCVGTSIKKL